MNQELHGYSMELHGYSMALHGIPWNSMNTPWKFRGIPWISMEFHGGISHVIRSDGNKEGHCLVCDCLPFCVIQ